MTVPEEPQKLTQKDFASGQDIRWCPGCGDYSVLSQMQKVLSELRIPREKFVFVSGIGCSSRFPYYMNTYGFHAIHGRALCVAIGIKCANPGLSVWVMTGDGDGLSIGGNHLIHALRRNVGLHIVLFNNKIYSLTKGQYSPTSDFGTVTKSSPYGTIEQPINPLSIALAAEATFVARSIALNPQHLAEMMRRSAMHQGSSFIEVLQNCFIFNEKAFADLTDRAVRDERILVLEHGKPMRFGKNKEYGICLKGAHLETVRVEEVGEESLLIHDETNPEPNIAVLLAQLKGPEFPTPIGVFRCVEKPTYENLMEWQMEEAIQRQGEGNLETFLQGSDSWTVS
ncbi:MAG: 2-oxoacid:ferredoxin oxidoreductase subunit beta [Candidatus Omnitrophota bacterium]